MSYYLQRDVMIQSEGGNVAVHLAEESRQKGKAFLMPQTERALVAHGILSRFLKAFINHVSTSLLRLNAVLYF